MSATRRKIAILLAYYTPLFEELNAKSKYLGENLKICLCDPKCVLDMLLKIDKIDTKMIFFIDTKRGKKAFVFLHIISKIQDDLPVNTYFTKL